MILSPDLSASGSLFVRRGDGSGRGTLRLLPDGWQASLNPLPDGDGPRERGGFASTAEAPAWAAVQPGAADDLSTVPGAEIHGPGALLPLVPWEGPHARIAVLLRERTWATWAETAFKTKRAPSIVAWRHTSAGGWAVRVGLRPEGDGRWTLWRVGQRPSTLARRANAESAHQRLHLQRLPQEALDRFEALLPPRSGPVPRPGCPCTGGSRCSAATAPSSGLSPPANRDAGSSRSPSGPPRRPTPRTPRAAGPGAATAAASPGNPADALRRLAALAADKLDPDAAAAMAETLDVAQDLRRICPCGGR